MFNTLLERKKNLWHNKYSFSFLHNQTGFLAFHFDEIKNTNEDAVYRFALTEELFKIAIMFHQKRSFGTTKFPSWISNRLATIEKENNKRQGAKKEKPTYKILDMRG